MTIDERIEALTVNIESLHSSVSELHAIAQSHDAQIVAGLTQSKQDAESIGALARIAEIHQRRLPQLEGGDTT